MTQVTVPGTTPLTFEITPPWEFQQVGNCRSCDAPIAWARHQVTWSMGPFDRDGRSHFATCPDAAKWRRRR